MVPSMMQDLLFDDILFGARAREEHRRFRQVLKFVADEVLEARDLLEDVLRDPDARNAVLTELATLLAWPPSVLLALNDLPPDRLAAGPRRGDRKAEARDHGLPGFALSAAARAELVLPARSVRRARATASSAARWRRAPAGGSRSCRARSSRSTRASAGEATRSGSGSSPRRSGVCPSRACGRRSRAATSSSSPPKTLVIGYSERTEKITIERLAEALRRGGIERQAHPRRRDSASARDDAPRHDLHAPLGRGVPLPRRR